MTVAMPVRCPDVNLHRPGPQLSADLDLRIEKVGPRTGVQRPGIDYLHGDTIGRSRTAVTPPESETPDLLKYHFIREENGHQVISYDW